MFDDAAKSVNKELSDTVKEPPFIPHPADVSNTEPSNLGTPEAGAPSSETDSPVSDGTQESSTDLQDNE
jgi:hypothetical protein